MSPLTYTNLVLALAVAIVGLVVTPVGYAFVGAALVLATWSWAVRADDPVAVEVEK